MPACRQAGKPAFCHIKLAAADEPLSIVRVAIYVVYLQPMYSAIKHKESNPNTFYFFLVGNLVISDFLKSSVVKLIGALFSELIKS